MSGITISRGQSFFFDREHITKELLTDSNVQLVYYHIEDKGNIGVTPDTNGMNVTILFYVLEGTLRVIGKSRDDILGPNDSIMLSDIKESVRFISQGSTKCLAFSTDNAQKVLNSVELQEMIKSVEKKDIYTYGHSRRVSHYAITIAQELNPDYDIITLGTAADLHDIGKVNTPSEILQKPGKLTPEEYEIIKEHPRDSYNILLPINPKLANAAGQHHERLDGSGYPNGIKGDEICMDAQIIAIADVLDAITCKRVYNEPMSMAEAVDYLEKRPAQYAKELVAILRCKLEDGTLLKEGIDSYFL